MVTFSKKKKITILASLGLLSIIAWFLFFNSSINVPTVPFGLPGGTKINIKEKASFPKSPTSVQNDLRRANDLRIANALDAAYNNYESILLKYPDLPEALFGAAYSLIASKNVSGEQLVKAKIHIEKLARQMPGSLWNRLLLTFSMEDEGNLSQALETAADLAKASPAFAEARLRYANLLLANKQSSKAIGEAKAAISISEGTDVRPFISLAFALHNIGSLKECLDLVNYAMPRFPSQTEFLLLHGFLNEYSYNFETAQNDYKKILMLNPGNSEALNAMATIGEKTPPTEGNYTSTSGTGMSLKDLTKETEKIMLPLIREYPENLPLKEALGRIYLKARMMKEARFQFSEIYSQDFEYPNIRRLLNEASEEFTSTAIPKNISPRNDKNLADSLTKAFAELKRSVNISDNNELGRYLVHYGATFKEFFSKYSVTRFEKLDERTFLEKYIIDSFRYNNTIYFDSQKNFYAVRSAIEDLSDKNSYDHIPDLFEHFLKKETGVLGEGVVAETVECGESERWSGVIWASRDNFELLMHNSRWPRVIFILRLNARMFPDTGNLCSYVPMIKGERKTPESITSSSPQTRSAF